MTRINKSKDGRIGPEPKSAFLEPVAIVDPESIGKIVMPKPKVKKKAKKKVKKKAKKKFTTVMRAKKTRK